GADPGGGKWTRPGGDTFRGVTPQVSLTTPACGRVSCTRPAAVAGRSEASRRAGGVSDRRSASDRRVPRAGGPPVVASAGGPAARGTPRTLLRSLTPPARRITPPRGGVAAAAAPMTVWTAVSA